MQNIFEQIWNEKSKSKISGIERVDNPTFGKWTTAINEESDLVLNLRNPPQKHALSN